MAKRWFGILDDKIAGCFRISHTMGVRLKALGIKNIVEKQDRKAMLNWQAEQNADNFNQFISVSLFETFSQDILANLRNAIELSFIPTNFNWIKEQPKAKIILQKKNFCQSVQKTPNTKITNSETTNDNEIIHNPEITNIKEELGLNSFFNFNQLFHIKSPLIVYTDGSYKAVDELHSDMHGMFTIVHQNKMKVFDFDISKSTINRFVDKYNPNDLAEMCAVDCALAQLLEDGMTNIPCVIVVDNTLLISSLIEQYRRHDVDELRQDVIEKLSKFKNISFRWCKGHSTNVGNIITDNAEKYVD